MPITIKSNLLKVRDNPNSDYLSIDAVSDSTTAERVQQIANAATTAQAQIESKKNIALSQITSVSDLQDIISETYNDAKTYSVGDYVIYNDNLYRCTTEITTAETWTAAHWTQVVFGGEVEDLKSAIIDLENLWHETSFVVNGWTAKPFNLIAGKTYVFTLSITGGIAYTASGAAPSSNIELIKDGFSANTAFEFTPTQNASFIRIWAGNSVLSVKLKDSAFDEEINKLSRFIGYKYVTDISESSLYESGNILYGNDDTFHQNNRFRTPIIRTDYDYVIKTSNSAARFAVFFFDANGEYVNYVTWQNNYYIPKGTIFRLCITLTPEVDDSKTLAETLAAFDFIKYDVAGAKNHNFAINNGIAYTLFEHGNIFYGNDDSYHGVSRARTIDILSFDRNIYLEYKTGSYIIYYFDTNNEFVEQTTWLQKSRTIYKGTHFRLLLTPDPDETESFPVETIVNGINMTFMPELTNGSCPNVIYACRNVDENVFPPESKYYVQAAAENQYDRVRFTVRLSSDNVWFCCHNETINELATNLDGTPISGTVTPYDKTIAQLNGYDWGWKYGPRFRGMGVPLAEEGLKFAALYNLGVTWHFSITATETEQNISNILAMTDKYGLTDNLIIISATGHNFDTCNLFKAHNPRISYYIGGEESWFYNSDNLANINALKTNYNRIYVQLYPWGTTPSDAFITFAKQNDFVLYDSITLSKDTLLSPNMLNKGYGYREVANVYMIKDTMRKYADSLVI